MRAIVDHCVHSQIGAFLIGVGVTMLLIALLLMPDGANVGQTREWRCDGPDRVVIAHNTIGPDIRVSGPQCREVAIEEDDK